MEDIPPRHRLLPAAIAYRALHEPERSYALLPRGDKLQDDFFTLTYGAFSRAVDEMSWWLDEMLGRVEKDRFKNFPTLPYIGANDFRYALLMYAAMKTARKALLPFAANTPEGLLSLLELSGSEVVMASDNHRELWKEPLALKPDLRFIEMPDIGHFIHDRAVTPYPYDRSYDEGMNDPVYMIQTSGTTGHPKPILATGRSVKNNIEVSVRYSDHAPSDQKLAVYGTLHGSYYPNILPMSWIAGLVSVAMLPLYLGDATPIVLPAATIPTPMTATYIDEMNRLVPKGSRNGLVMTPDVLRETVGHAKYRQGMKRYDWIGYAGAPLDHVTGDLVASLVPRLQSFNGSTDTGVYPLLLNDPVDWKIHRFPRDHEGYHLEFFTDDLYELCIRRQPDDHRAVFTRDAECQIWHTNDLWRKVPGREGFYAGAGRVDDFIKLSSMTKFNAIAIEQSIDGHPDVAKSLVAGDDQARPFIIVEPAPEILASCSTVDVLGRAWRACEAANEKILPEARLTKELTLIADPAMPIKRTAKGTVDRRSTIKMYEKRIENLSIMPQTTICIVV
ncbi:hypothetical protein LTR85_007368 [Meristemomyces frigidus]|nr:hypothetical protein LTR85_007368 [Meristemomyces frigidus]